MNEQRRAVVGRISDRTYESIALARYGFDEARRICVVTQRFAYLPYRAADGFSKSTKVLSGQSLRRISSRLTILPPVREEPLRICGLVLQFDSDATFPKLT